MMPEVPRPLRSLAERWCAADRPAQSAISWPRAAWTTSMPEYARVLDRLPDRLGRSDVNRIGAAVTDGHDAALAGFVVAMVWGYGNVGYGPWRTRRILQDNPSAAVLLSRAAAIQVEAGAVASYRYLANEGRVRYLGPAFATKFLHFVPQAAEGPPALILDAIVSRAIASMTGVRLRSTVWRTTTYERYLELVAGWSDALDLEPATIEMLLFVSQSPGQWTEPWLRDT